MSGYGGDRGYDDRREGGDRQHGRGYYEEDRKRDRSWDREEARDDGRRGSRPRRDEDYEYEDRRGRYREDVREREFDRYGGRGSERGGGRDAREGGPGEGGGDRGRGGGGDDEKKTVFIGNLPFRMTQDELADLFQPIGPTEYIKVGKKPDGSATGTAWVAYLSAEHAQMAIDEHHGKSVGGRDIFVTFARSRGEKARILDGSGGGGPRNGPRSGRYPDEEGDYHRRDRDREYDRSRDARNPPDDDRARDFGHRRRDDLDSRRDVREDGYADQRERRPEDEGYHGDRRRPRDEDSNRDVEPRRGRDEDEFRGEHPHRNGDYEEAGRRRHPRQEEEFPDGPTESRNEERFERGGRPSSRPAPDSGGRDEAPDFRFVIQSLPFMAKIEDVEQAIASRVDAAKITVLRSDDPSRENKGLAFVEMRSVEEAEAALAQLADDPLYIDNRKTFARRYTQEKRPSSRRQYD